MTLLTPELLARAYAAGIFPMGDDDAPGEIYWMEPRWRGVFPLDSLHVSRSLARAIRRGDYEARIDADFEGAMRACAARERTWITPEIIAAYTALHREGRAHSVEIYRGGALIGGLYGVSLGGAFFGESMFSRETDASKIALVHLVARLRVGGYRLLDAQYLTPHLESLGAVEISRDDYRVMLAEALIEEGDFYKFDADSNGASVLQAATQTS